MPIIFTSFSVTQFNVRLFRVRENFRHNAPTTVDEIQAQSSIGHPIDFDLFAFWTEYCFIKILISFVHGACWTRHAKRVKMPTVS